MLKINDKTFLNIQEAVQWLMDNNALPFQCTANYAANTEIGLGTIVNPTMAKVRIGSLIFFADSKVSTVTGVTSNGFIVSDQYNDLVDDVVYVSNVQLNASGHLIVTLSNGTQIDAGLIKQVASFSIDASQHLIATYNDGSTNDLGAIFTGNVNIGGNLTAAIIQANAGLKSNFLEPINAPVVSIGDISISSISSPNSDPIVVYPPIKCLDKIYDSNGHQRFVNGNIAVSTTGINYTFQKWALSGNHLMIVLAGEIEANATISPYTMYCTLTDLPQWIVDKVIPATGNIVDAAKILVSDNVYEPTDTGMSLFLAKEGNYITANNIRTFTNSGVAQYFRVAFDLIID